MEYLVLFLNEAGTELYRTMVKEGDTAIYEGQVPRQENKVFVGWNKSLKEVRDNLIVTAVFEKQKQGTLKLGAMSFVENEQSIDIIDQAVITNRDLQQNKQLENEKER